MAVRAWRQLGISKSFHAWQGYTQDSLHKAECMSAAIDYHRERHLPGALHWWHEWVEGRVRRRYTSALASRHWRYCALWTVLHSWKVRARAWQLQRQVAHFAAGSMDDWKLKRAVRLWSVRARTQRMWRFTNATAVHHCRQTALARTLQTWLSNMRVQQESHARGVAAVDHWRVTNVGSCLRFWRVYAALVVGHAILSFYITCEHRGLPTEGTILERTRSLQTPAWMRWLLWNMPYHAEHHGWPAVPFHALPKLHETVREHLVHRVSPAYLHTHGGREPTSEAPSRSSG